jgi:hypothetical protein
MTAEITATFMTFIEHHNVVPEIAQDLSAAAALARGAHTLIIEAKAFEDALCDGTGWNRAAWTLWGGEWAGAERGGLEREGEVHIPEQVEGSDGGWNVDIGEITKQQS